MKTRIIVAVIAIPLLLAVIFLAPIWAWGIVVGAIAACASWEMLHCAEPGAKLRFVIYAAVSAALIPFSMSVAQSYAPVFCIVFLLFAVMCCELMLTFRDEKPMALETVVLVLFAGALIPMLLGSLVRLGLRDNGSVFILLPLVATCGSDSAAYFVGGFIGKHKLAPRLSPKKTIEGSVGGFAGAIVLVLLYGLVLKLAKFEVNFLILAIYGFFGSLTAQLGDLSFSAIKRLYGVKDYGRLIPGHGGALDRFDSAIFTAPVVEMLLLWGPTVITKLSK